MGIVRKYSLSSSYETADGQSILLPNMIIGTLKLKLYLHFLVKNY